jgi:hypothetical protein
MLYWLCYAVSAFFGLALAPAITKVILGVGSDGGMMTCYVVGIVLTTIVLMFIKWREVKFIYQLLSVCIIGLLSFIPGYLVAWLISALHIF